MLNTHKFLIMGSFIYRTCKELVVGFRSRESRQYPVGKRSEVTEDNHATKA